MLLPLFFFAVLCGSLSAQTDIPPPNCRPGLVVDCIRNHEDVVWAIDTELDKCIVFVNRCVFNNANCNKYKQNLPLYKESTEEECQKLCVNDCSKEIGEPVCAKRGENFCTFANDCELKKEICNSGQPWGIELDRFCDKQSSASVCPKA